MSAFICSDLHFSTIANHLHNLNNNIVVQELANKLKTINIDSVNYRYKENTRKSKCKIVNNWVNTKPSEYDVIRLIQCWNYQSSEKSDNLDYIVMSAFLLSHFDSDKIEQARNYSSLWSI